MKRKRSSPEFELAKSSARYFFGGKICVVTSETAGIHWHHFNERSENNPVDGSNLVPIAGTLNQNIDDDNKDRKTKLDVLSDKLNLDYLKSVSRNHWKNGNFAACYGVNRLGSFIAFKNNKKPTKGLLFAIEALHSLRPLWKEDFAIDTIQRNIIPILCEPQINVLRRVSIDSKAALCKEVASWYLSSNDFKFFQKWRFLGNKFSAFAKKMAATDDSVEIRARLLQHHGFLHYQQGNHGLATKLLKKADEIMREIHYYHGISNNHQYFMRLALQNSSISLTKQIDLLEERMELVKKDFWEITEEKNEWVFQNGNNLEFWAGIPLYKLKAELFYRKSLNKKWKNHKDYYERAFNLLDDVSGLLRRKRIQALTVFPESAILTNLNKFDLGRNVKGLTGFIRYTKMSLKIRALFDELYELLKITSSDIFEKTKTDFP